MSLTRPDEPSATPKLAAVPVCDLVALLCRDIRQRWAGGECVLAEEYFERFPTLHEHADAALDLVYAELLLREEQGERPSREEILKRFPTLAEALGRQLDLHEVLRADGASVQTLPAATLPFSPKPEGMARTGLPVVPGYELLDRLGQGGMGVVYRARQVALGRVVALKMIVRAEYAGAEERRRFVSEAEAVARLRHAHVVQIYELGQHDGLPYFSMELCQGGSLESRLDGTPWEGRAAARLVEVVARAVHAAHAEGVIHRDLKPGNVLLTEDGAPKVSDFGLAKQLDRQGATQTNLLVGTPGYMAPEQARGAAHVGPAADVYALGAILYRLLTGRPPFAAPDVVETILQTIQDDPVPVRRLQPTVARDLETICHKCLEKGPEKRYQSALELAEDLRRFHAGEPVVARPVGAWGRLVRWARRRPGVASLVAMVVLALAGGTAFSLFFAWQAADRATEAQNNATKAQEQEQAAKLNAARAETQRHLAAVRLYDADMRRAQEMWEQGRPDLVRELLDAQSPERKGGEDLRGFEWYYWRRVLDSPLTLRGHAGKVSALQFSPDGARLVTASEDETVRMWDVGTGRELRALRGHGSVVSGVCFSPDGTRVASAGWDQTVRVCDAANGREQLVLRGLPWASFGVTWSPDGRRIAAAGGGTARTWDAGTGEPLGAIAGAIVKVEALAYSPDGATLAVGFQAVSSVAGRDSTLHLFDPDGKRTLVKLDHRDAVSALAWSPDGSRLAAAGAEGRITVWDVTVGKQALQVSLPSGRARAVGFSPDGTRLAGGGLGGAVQVWDSRSGAREATYRGHTREITAVSFSPDGLRLASASADQTVKLWDTTTPPEGTVVPLTELEVRNLTDRVALGPGGAVVGVAAERQPIRLWNARSGDEQERLAEQNQLNGALSIGPVDMELAGAGPDHVVRVWAPRTGAALKALTTHSRPVRCTAFRPDGKLVASGGVDAVIHVCSRAGDARPLELTGHTGPVAALCFHPRRDLVASASDDGSVRIWGLPEGKCVQFLRPNVGELVALCYGSDGSRLAAGARNGTIVVWDAERGEQVLSIAAHAGDTSVLAFLPQEDRLVSGGTDRVVRVWDLRSGQEALALRGHSYNVRALACPHEEPSCIVSATGQEVICWPASDPSSQARRQLSWRAWQARKAQRAGDWFAAQWNRCQVARGYHQLGQPREALRWLGQAQATALRADAPWRVASFVGARAGGPWASLTSAGAPWGSFPTGPVSMEAAARVGRMLRESETLLHGP